MSQKRVSGFPEKGADLRGSLGNFRGSLGNFRGSLGNFRGSLGNFRGTSGLLLSSTVRELPGKSPKNFRGSRRKTSGEVRGLPRSSGEPDSLPATRQICLQFRKRSISARGAEQEGRNPAQGSRAQRTAALKILRVVNLLRVVLLVRRGDLLLRRTLCGHHFPGNYRHVSSPRRVRNVVNLGGRIKKHCGVVIHFFCYRRSIFVRKGPEALGPLRDLGIRPFVSVIRGLGNPFPEAPEPRKGTQGLGGGSSGASERCVRFQRSGERRWAIQRPLWGPVFPDAPEGVPTLGFLPSGHR